MQSKMDRLILASLDEDIPTEDLSTNAIITGYVKGKAQLLCKQDGIIAGLDVFARTFALLDDSTEVIFHCQDGDAVQSGELLAEVIGDIRIILSGERTALNYLQRMSGIATHTRKIVDLLEGSGITLLDTRKTTPNNRIFEKYAVKVGGGHNHRFSLGKPGNGQRGDRSEGRHHHAGQYDPGGDDGSRSFDRWARPGGMLRKPYR
ncbi:MAG: hypothetical protein PWP61_1172, partial [Trichococcus sp.]|nr:hypothetical protein [Trichococcus sp.]